MMTPSAERATSAACFGFEIPKPTHTGLLVMSFTFLINVVTLGGAFLGRR